MELFSIRLRELRKNKGLRQKDIAEALEISVTCYAGYEQGAHEPDFKVLCKIARYFGVSADYLLGLEDESGSRPHIKP